MPETSPSCKPPGPDLVEDRGGRAESPDVAGVEGPRSLGFPVRARPAYGSPPPLPRGHAFAGMTWAGLSQE